MVGLVWWTFDRFFVKSDCLTQLLPVKWVLIISFILSKGKTFSVEIHLFDLKSGILQISGRKPVRINLAASSELPSSIPFHSVRVEGIEERKRKMNTQNYIFVEIEVGLLLNRCNIYY